MSCPEALEVSVKNKNFIKVPFSLIKYSERVIIGPIKTARAKSPKSLLFSRYYIHMTFIYLPEARALSQKAVIIKDLNFYYVINQNSELPLGEIIISIKLIKKSVRVIL